MSTATLDVKRTEEGFLENAADWSEDVAEAIASELNIKLTDKHWELIKFLREQHEAGVELTIRKVAASGMVDIKEFYQLFPGGPLKNASKVAGLPRPTACL